MCETCIDAEDAADQIINLKAKYDSEDVTTWSEDDQLRYQVWHTLVMLADAHQKLAKHQHDVFMRQCENVQPKQIVACADYKAKVMLGQRQKQRNSEYYEIPLRSLLGVTLMIHPSDFEKVRDVLQDQLQVYDPTGELDQPVQLQVEEIEVEAVDRRGKTREKHGDPQQPIQRNVKKVWRVHFEFLSEIVSQNGWQTIQCFKKLFEHPLLQALNPNRIDLWMDNGSHFKNKELYAYFAKLRAFQMCWHHFAPCHGKSVCDTRFAILQHWFNQEILTSKTGMNNLQDVIAVIQHAQQESNRARLQEGKRPIISFQVIVDVPEMPKNVTILQFAGVRAFYSFIVRVDRAGKHFVYAATFTDLNEDGAAVLASYNRLDAQFEDTERVGKLTRGLPDPEAPHSLLKAQVAVESEQRSQKQRCKVNDSQFIAESVQQLVRDTARTSDQRHASFNHHLIDSSRFR